MNIPFLIILLVCIKSLYWIYIWQLKEYRTDRMRDFLSTDTGKKKIWKNRFTVLDGCIFLAAITGTYIFQSVFFLLLAYSFLIIEIILYVLARSQYKPKLTSKVIALFVATNGIGWLLAMYASPFFSVDSVEFLYLFLSLLTPCIVTLLVLSLHPLSLLIKRCILMTARRRLNSLPKKPIVIGITGSFGKTTTKEYLATLLSEKYRVLATPEHVNVDIGVARTILTTLNPSIQIFIVEMGAYKPKEIESTCALVQPDIGILTAIADQHLSLFGDIATIQKTKGELVRALPKEGLCVVNADFPLALEACRSWSRAPIFTYSTSKEANITTSDVQVEEDSVSARYHGRRMNFSFKAPMYGKHVLDNLLAAICVAEYLGLSEAELHRGIARISTLPGTMQKIIGKTGATIIDDHYNSNPDGFAAALQYLALFKKSKKIVVTPGMLELGNNSHEHHVRVGKLIGSTADLCIITKTDFAADLTLGIQAGSKKTETILCKTAEEAIEILRKTTNTDCVLLEGRSYATIISTLV